MDIISLRVSLLKQAYLGVVFQEGGTVESGF